MNTKITKFLTIAAAWAFATAGAEQLTEPIEGQALPQAYVTHDMEAARTQGLEDVYVFNAFEDDSHKAIWDKLVSDPPQALTAAEEAIADRLRPQVGPYLDYHADFVISFDRDVEVGDVQLSGNYGTWGWLTFDLPRDMAAGDELRLLSAGTDSVKTFSYYMIIDQVGKFLCGPKNLNPVKNHGLKLTVELRLYEPVPDSNEDRTDVTNGAAETGSYYVAGRYSHIFLNPDLVFVDEVQVRPSAQAFETRVEGELSSAEQTVVTDLVNKTRGEINANIEIKQANTGIHAAASQESVVAALKTAAGENWKDAITEKSNTDRFVEINVNAAEVQVVPGSSPTAAIVQAIVYDVTPKATVRVIRVEGDGADKIVTTNSVEAVIPNSAITQPITFRLPVPEGFTKNAIVEHQGDSNRLLPVLGPARGRYVELSSQRFSEFTVRRTDEKLPVTVDSPDVLGCVKYVNKAASVGTDVVVGVPWIQAGVRDGSNVTVDKLISAGLTSGDIIRVWNEAGNHYDSYAWDGAAWEAVYDAKYDEPVDANASRIARGKAFWYTRQNLTDPFALVGLVGGDDFTTATAAGKLTLLVNPYPRATTVNALLTSANGAQSGDQVVLVDSDKRYVFEGGKWGHKVPGTTTTLPNGIVVTGPRTFQEDPEIALPAGQAFWYISASGAPAIKWN